MLRSRNEKLVFFVEKRKFDSVGTRFEFLPEHLLYSFRLFVIFLRSPSQMREATLTVSMALPLHRAFASYSSFHAIWPRILWSTESPKSAIVCVSHCNCLRLALQLFAPRTAVVCVSHCSCLRLALQFPFLLSFSLFTCLFYFLDGEYPELRFRGPLIT